MVSGKAVEYESIKRADMIAIGSIMNRERKARGWLLPRRLHVWGSGTDAPDRVFSDRHYYHAVRGKLTRDQIDGGQVQGVALGDPGLLVSDWWEGRPRPGKRYRLGFIPHYVDRQAAVVDYAMTLSGVKLIDVYWPIEEILRTVQECEFIISSSMHGLIVSDAFGVPNRRIAISRGVISDYKFDDYYSAFGLDSPICLTPEAFFSHGNAPFDTLVGDYVRPGLDEIKKALVAAFPLM